VGFRGFVRVLADRIRDFFTNWREYDAPVGTKVGLTLRNRARALFSRAQCCGHPGQPGC
jgi:hypothetical protein